jgi:hypothetical protein
MKTPLKYLLGVAGGGLLLLLVTPAPSHGDATSDLTALVDDLAAQQLKLDENQTKIDEKIATIAEDVRQARLFVARGGGHR